LSRRGAGRRAKCVTVHGGLIEATLRLARDFEQAVRRGAVAVAWCCGQRSFP
jgi:hypothetical protein